MIFSRIIGAARPQATLGDFRIHVRMSAGWASQALVRRELRQEHRFSRKPGQNMDGVNEDEIMERVASATTTAFSFRKPRRRKPPLTFESSLV